jgi:hypothetical protein
MSFQAVEYVIAQNIPSAPQKLVLMCIAHHVDRDTGRWRISQADIAEDASMSIRQVKEHSKALEADFRIVRYTHRSKSGAMEDYEYELVGYADWVGEGRKRARQFYEQARTKLVSLGAETRTRQQGAETRTKHKVRKPALRIDPNPHPGLTETRTHIEEDSPFYSPIYNQTPLPPEGDEASANGQAVDLGGATQPSLTDVPFGRARGELKLDEKRKRGRSEKPDPSSDERFMAFYRQYPRREGRTAAFRAFTKLTAEEQQQAIQASPLFAKRERNTERQYIPLPATWLNGGRFDAFEVDPGEQDAKRIQAIALDLHNGTENYKQYWKLWSEIPPEKLKAGEAYRQREFLEAA